MLRKKHFLFDERNKLQVLRSANRIKNEKQPVVLMTQQAGSFK